MPVRRALPAGTDLVADPVGHPDRDPAGHRQVAFAGRRLCTARCAATSEVEQKVCTATLGPYRSNR